MDAHELSDGLISYFSDPSEISVDEAKALKTIQTKLEKDIEDHINKLRRIENCLIL